MKAKKKKAKMATANKANIVKVENYLLLMRDYKKGGSLERVGN